MDPISQLSATSHALSSMARSGDQKVRSKAMIDSIVVILNSNDFNDDYIQEIQLKCNKNVLKFIELTPIEFNFINTKTLFEALIDVHNWSAICITSKRCVDALQLAINYDKSYDIIDLWIKYKKRVFVVGIKSYEYLKDRLKWEAIGSDCGNGDNLAKLMINELRDELSVKPVLYPCSQSRSDCLPQLLTNAGIGVKEITVYQTIDSKHLRENFIQLNNYVINCLEEREERVSTPLKVIFIFFSPSGLKSVYPFLTEYMFNNNKIIDKIVMKYIAIGRTTGSALQSSALNVWFISPKPNPKSLAQALSENLELMSKT